MPFDVIVVGGGIWGDSARQCFQDAGQSVCVIYDQEASAASEDVARIIRAEYSDHAYRQLADRSIEIFRSRNPYMKYYHEPGWLLVQNEGTGEHESIPAGSQQVAAGAVTRDFPSASISEGAVVTATSRVGWVEANNLLQSLRDANPSSELRYGRVTGLLRQGSSCCGVRMGDTEIQGRRVVLATGWGTNKILRDQGLPIMAYDIVGVAVLGIKLSEQQYTKYKNVKILCDPEQGEILPPTSERILRVNNPRSYLFHPHTAAAPIVPPSHSCFRETWTFLGKYCPDLLGCPVVISRICLDALTEGQTFYMESLSDLRNVVCIGGGSFHSWKFRPVLPDLIASRLGLCKYDDVWEALSQRQSQKHAGVVPRRRWAEQE